MGPRDKVDMLSRRPLCHNVCLMVHLAVHASDQPRAHKSQSVRIFQTRGDTVVIRRACVRFYSKANVRFQKFVSCAIVPRDAWLGTLPVNHAPSSRLSDIDRLSGRGNVSPISISTRTPRDTRECTRTAPADRKTGSLRIMKNWVTQSDGLLVSTSLHENRP